MADVPPGEHDSLHTGQSARQYAEAGAVTEVELENIDFFPPQDSHKPP